MEKTETQRGSLNLPEITQLWVGGLSLPGTEAGVWATLWPVPHSPCCPRPLQGPQPQDPVLSPSASDLGQIRVATPEATLSLPGI